MFLQNYILILFLFFQFPEISSFKIVIFVPTLTNSQIVFNYRIGELLAASGNDVTMYRPQYNPDAQAGAPKLVKEIRFKAYLNEALYREAESERGSDAFTDEAESFAKIQRAMEMLYNSCETQISNKDLMSRLRAEKFDLAISHMYDFCPLGMIHALNIPSYIWMTSATLFDHMTWAVGAPAPPSYVPSLLTPFSDSMTYFQRMKNFLTVLMMLNVVPYMVSNPQTMLFRKYFGQDFPDLMTIGGKSPLVFVNSIDLFDFPRPILHKIIYIGGIGMKEPQKLEPKWEKVLEDSQDGVVIVSFGSAANSSGMPESWKKAFLTTFSKFPKITFIWKYEHAHYPEAKKFSNVFLTDWLPQNDILGHPKTRVFVTHGGYNSVIESVFAGVPLIAIPLFGDQFGNVRRMEKHSLGIAIDKSDVSETTLLAAMTEILETNKISTAAKRMSSMLKKKPTKPEELLVGWVEFLAEFQDLSNLEPGSMNLSLIQYFLVDVVLGIVTMVIVFIFILCFITRRCCRICFYGAKSKTE